MLAISRFITDFKFRFGRSHFRLHDEVWKTGRRIGSISRGRRIQSWTMVYRVIESTYPRDARVRRKLVSELVNSSSLHIHYYYILSHKIMWIIRYLINCLERERERERKRACVRKRERGVRVTSTGLRILLELYYNISRANKHR